MGCSQDRYATDEDMERIISERKLRDKQHEEAKKRKKTKRRRKRES